MGGEIAGRTEHEHEGIGTASPAAVSLTRRGKLVAAELEVGEKWESPPAHNSLF